MGIRDTRRPGPVGAKSAATGICILGARAAMQTALRAAVAGADAECPRIPDRTRRAERQGEGMMRGVRPDLAALDFNDAPFLVIWETTRACDLACRHCRADAVTRRNPLELSTDEAKRMMDDVRRFG